MATWPKSSPDWIIDQALLNVAAGVATSAAFNSVPTESCQRTSRTVNDTAAQVSRHRNAAGGRRNDKARFVRVRGGALLTRELSRGLH